MGFNKAKTKYLCRFLWWRIVFFGRWTAEQAVYIWYWIPLTTWKEIMFVCWYVCVFFGNRPSYCCRFLSNFFSNQKWQIIAQCTHRKVRKMIHSDGLREVFRDFNFRNCENSCHFYFILFASAIMIKAYDSVFGFVFALLLSVLRSDFTAKWVGDFENRKTVIHWSYYQWAIENRYFSFRMAAARNVLFRDSVHSTHRNATRS